MAKVEGPLFSLGAHGHLKERITYSNRKTYNLVRFQKKNKDAKSEDQLQERALFLEAKKYWLMLTAVERELWHSYNKTGAI